MSQTQLSAASGRPQPPYQNLSLVPKLLLGEVMALEMSPVKRAMLSLAKLELQRRAFPSWSLGTSEKFQSSVKPEHSQNKFSPRHA